MIEQAQYRYEITGIDCADCAAGLEEKIRKIEGIRNVSLSFIKNSLVYECDHDEGKRIEEEMKALIAKEEPDARVVSKGHKHLHHDSKAHHESCQCHEEEQDHHEHCHRDSEDHHHHDHEHEHDKNHEHCHCDTEDHDHHDHEHEEHHEHCHCHDHEEEEQAQYRYEITGIDCADCAAGLEEKIRKIAGIRNVSLSFIKNSLVYECDHDEGKRIEEEMRALVAKEEPDARVVSKGHKHLSQGHGDGHEEHHHESGHAGRCRLKIVDIDCADCAAELERKIAGIDGISNVRLSFMNSLLTYDAENPKEAEDKIRRLVSEEEPDAKVFSADEKDVPSEENIEHSENRVMILRLAAGAVLFIISLFLTGTAETVTALIAYAILGYDVVLKAVRGIGRGQVFDENFLMTVATFAAMYLKDFREAAGVMLFYQIGEFFQKLAVERSRKSIGDLMNIRPDSAWVKRGDDYVMVSPEEVRIGEIIRVRPGERVPLDGTVVSGASSLNTASLTGESRLRDVDRGDQVISGSVNETGVIDIEVTQEYGDSTVARILDLVENQDSSKAEAESFITKFSRVYTPVVVFSAIAAAVIVSLVTKDVNEGIYRACTFLVISCPCALVISVPLSFFAGIGGLSSRGILVKGANQIEPLAKLRQIVFDKTGTLTKGTFAVAEIRTEADRDKVLECAAYAEAFSNHPIAEGIRNSWGKPISQEKIKEVKEIPGRGVMAAVENRKLLAGNIRLMEDYGIACTAVNEPGTMVYVAEDGRYLGCVILEDTLKEDAISAIQELKESSVRCIMVSGDNRTIVEKAGERLGMDQVYGECMPGDKVERLSELRSQGLTAFVGDGVNDAPVLAAADLGFAMGALGSDAAIEAADIVIMDDRVSGIPLAITSARRILRVVNENIYGAIAVKIITLILGALGIANMWWAIFADTGVAMLCVLNAMRLLRIARKEG